MSAGSWVRFAVGLVLAIETIRLAFAGGSSALAIALSVIYIALVASFVLFKF